MYHLLPTKNVLQIIAPPWCNSQVLLPCSSHRSNSHTHMTPYNTPPSHYHTLYFHFLKKYKSAETFLKIPCTITIQNTWQTLISMPLLATRLQQSTKLVQTFCSSTETKYILFRGHNHTNSITRCFIPRKNSTGINTSHTTLKYTSLTHAFSSLNFYITQKNVWETTRCT
jgi:hypothetical protein